MTAVIDKAGYGGAVLQCLRNSYHYRLSQIRPGTERPYYSVCVKASVKSWPGLVQNICH